MWKFYNSNGAILQSTAPGDDDQTAPEVPYTVAVGADWGTDPDDVAEALDQAAARITDAEAILAPGVASFGPSIVTSITVTNGIVTAIS